MGTARNNNKKDASSMKLGKSPTLTRFQVQNQKVVPCHHALRIGGKDGLTSSAWLGVLGQHN